MSFFTGWFGTGLMVKSYRVEGGISYLSQSGLSGLFLLVTVITLVSAFLYMKKREAAKVAMFVSLTGYLCLSVLEYKDQLAYALIVLAVISLVFLYVRSDVIALLGK